MHILRMHDVQYGALSLRAEKHLFNEEDILKLQSENEADRIISSTSWRDAATWNCWQMLKDVIVFAKVNSLPLGCYFDDNGYLVSGQTESSIESRFYKNWSWITTVIRDMYGWIFRPIPKRKAGEITQELRADVKH